MNPFSIKTYSGPEYFFDREDETAKLFDALNNGRNITLFSHRRLGKTMLLQHVFAGLDKGKYQPLFIDLYATRNLVHFTRKMTEILAEKKIIRENLFYKFLGRLGASLTFDPLTGSPRVNFSLDNRAEIIRSIPELFKQLDKSNKTVVIAMDEFQEVAGYEEENSEAVIRTLMQEFPGITFIYSGSKKSLMKDMFSDSGRPFFQSTQLMELHEINRNVYADEVGAVLDKHKKGYDREVIFRILDETYCHTGFTQLVLSRVFSESESKIDIETFNHIWEDILIDYQSLAREQEFLLPSLQWKIYLAIAKEGYVKEPYSIDFIKSHDLSAPSSVSRAIKALLDKGLIIESGDQGLRLYNVFIEKNLRRLFSL